MPEEKKRRQPRPLDAETLEKLALRYVERYATSETKLARYLTRKLRERGWGDENPANIEAIVAKLAAYKFVDDEAFAEGKAASLARRGYGPRRLEQSLRADGIAEKLRAKVTADVDARAAAIAYARRRRFGPFSTKPLTRELREKQFSAMVRAGHEFGLAAEILDARSVDLTAFE